MRKIEDIIYGYVYTNKLSNRSITSKKTFNTWYEALPVIGAYSIVRPYELPMCTILHRPHHKFLHIFTTDSLLFLNRF